MGEMQQLVADNAAERLADVDQDRRVPQPIYRSSGPVAASFMPGHEFPGAEVQFAVHGQPTLCSEQDAWVLLAVLAAALSAKEE